MVTSLTSAALADIPRPDKPKKPAKSIDTSLSIRIDRDAKEARLIIPKDQVQQLRAALDQYDAGDNSSAANVTGAQTIVSGALLSLAFVFGGMWFVRSGHRHSKAVITTAIILACGSVATLVYGNAGPPSEARSITGKMFSQSVHMYKAGWGAIKLEVSDDARNPELIVPDTPKTPAE
ncbi:MAG: hypothetical protein DMF63_00235 [Acidobacteria bacterium]|nr:MAG: hypothetical protein DMF63_00235 [Acidobacteriota bacterium]